MALIPDKFYGARKRLTSVHRTVDQGAARLPQGEGIAGTGRARNRGNNPPNDIETCKERAGAMMHQKTMQEEINQEVFDGEWGAIEEVRKLLGRLIDTADMFARQSSSASVENALHDLVRKLEDCTGFYVGLDEQIRDEVFVC